MLIQAVRWCLHIMTSWNSRSDEETERISLESSERRELALSGDDKPVILKVEIPEIKGVVVVAEGADDFLVKQELNSAVCAPGSSETWSRF